MKKRSICVLKPVLTCVYIRSGPAPLLLCVSPQNSHADAKSPVHPGHPQIVQMSYVAVKSFLVNRPNLFHENGGIAGQAAGHLGEGDVCGEFGFGALAC